MKSGDLVSSKYRLVNRLGQGGMGAVWSAVHLQTGRDLAIKFLHPIVASENEDARQRFIQEARTSSRVNHPNIIDVFDAGESEDGTLFLVMELLDGMSLADALRANPPLNAHELLVVLGGAALALAAAHEAGIVHRDIKPPNIYLHRHRSTGRVVPKLLDFGVSKLLAEDGGIATHTGSLLGSPRYMSPEQAVSAARADGRSDIWSFGVMLFEAFTGEFPHDGDSSNSLVVAIATKPPKSIHSVAPQLPHGLRMLIDDCLQPVDARIQSALELVQRLRDTLEAHDLSDLVAVLPARIKKRVLRPDDLRIDTSVFLARPDLDLDAPSTIPEIDLAPMAELEKALGPAGEEQTLIRGLTLEPSLKDVRKTQPMKAAPQETVPLGVARTPKVAVDPSDSVSSVVRGLTGQGSGASVTPPGPPTQRPQRSMLTLSMAGLGAVALAAIAVIAVKTGGSPEQTMNASPAASSSAGHNDDTSTAITIAPEPKSTVLVTPSLPGEEKTPAPSSSAVASPSTFVSNRPAPRPTSSVGRPPAPNPGNDPLRKLGSGIQIRRP